MVGVLKNFGLSKNIEQSTLRIFLNDNLIESKFEIKKRVS